MSHNRVLPFVLKEFDGALRSRIIASRAGLAAVLPVEDEGFAGRVVKLCFASELEGDDFIVQCVNSNGRRSVRLIAGSLPADLESALSRLPHVGEEICDRDSTAEGASLQVAGRTVVNVAA